MASAQGAAQSLPLNCAVPLVGHYPMLCANQACPFTSAADSLGKTLLAWHHNSKKKDFKL